MVDFLMRHQGGVEGRYYDPSPEECAAAVGKIPNLWPDVMGGDRKSAPHNDCGPKDLRDGPEKSGEDALASGVDSRYSVSGATQTKHSSESVSRSAPPPSVAPPSHEGPGPEHDPDSFGGKPGEISGKLKPEPLGASPRHFGSIAGADPIALADFLESLARLLRQGACDGRNTAAGPPGNRTTQH
jgi:hypothetical protein